jgi:hypothetical protein
MWGALSDERTVCCLQLLLASASVVILGSESLGTRDRILLSQILDFHFRRLLRLAGCRDLFILNRSPGPDIEHLLSRLYLPSQQFGCLGNLTVNSIRCLCNGLQYSCFKALFTESLPSDERLIRWVATFISEVPSNLSQYCSQRCNAFLVKQEIGKESNLDSNPCIKQQN